MGVYWSDDCIVETKACVLVQVSQVCIYACMCVYVCCVFAHLGMVVCMYVVQGGVRIQIYLSHTHNLITLEV
jgi:hypothetical protein